MEHNERPIEFNEMAPVQSGQSDHSRPKPGMLPIYVVSLFFFATAAFLWVSFSGGSNGYLIQNINNFFLTRLGSGRFFLVALLFGCGYSVLRRRLTFLPGRLGLYDGIFLILLVILLLGVMASAESTGAESAGAEGLSGGAWGRWIFRTLMSWVGGARETGFILWVLLILVIGGLLRVQRWLLPLFQQSAGALRTREQSETDPAPLENARSSATVQRKKNRKKETETDMPLRNNQLPPLNLLTPEMGLIEKKTDVQSRIAEIETAMMEFGTPVNVIGFSAGPGIIQFQVTPGVLEKPGGRKTAIPKKIRVAQVDQRERDLAVRLGVANLSIQAPVPGESFIGIDIPNPDAMKVRLRPLIESNEFQSQSSPLSIALGRDISGTPVVVDLAQMPHLLVAGTTNSGKSICLRSMAVCLAMNNTPEQLRIVMIDPKRVELFRFNGLPHLLGKVETEYERSIAVLGWAVQEMKNRYKLFETVGVRKLTSYNRYAEKNGEKPLPYIVIFIDELAEIMRGVDKQGQEYIDMLASLARATGMHLVVATQRPDTTIITGKIKTNIPARIALNVASAIDSRVIMGKQGAEKLLGRGDMYFVDPSLNVPVRIQGPLLTDDEIDAVVDLWKKMAPKPANEPELAPWEDIIDAASGEENSRDEKILRDAIRLVCRTRKASASYLQVKLNVSFPTASRLLNRMEQIGVVGPVQAGGKAREVIWSEDEADSYGDDAGYQED